MNQHHSLLSVLMSHIRSSFFPAAFPRLDLVPINRSVGLKAKPTKPVTEVLRPVVAKYGLHLGDLVAKIVSPPPVASDALLCLGPESSL